MDHGYLGNVGKHKQNPCVAWLLVHYTAQQMLFLTDSRDQQVAVVAINLQSVWTPLLWSRGSTPRSWTVWTFIQNLQWRQSLLHPGGRVCGSPIHVNRFRRATWDGRATFREASPIQIVAMEKRLQFQHVLNYTSIPNWTTGYNQHFHLVYWAHINIVMEKRLPFWNRHSKPTHTYAYIYHQTTVSERLDFKGKWRSSASFVERKATSPQGHVTDFDIDSSTHDSDREAAYRT